jgi:ABC-type dipeptide/oligopeptide/nickel transport system permease component
MAGKRSLIYYLKQTVMIYTCVLSACMLLLIGSPISMIDGANTFGIAISDSNPSLFSVVYNTLFLQLGNSFYTAVPALYTAAKAFSHSVTFSMICLLVLMLSSIFLSILSFYFQTSRLQQQLVYVSATPSIVYLSCCYLVMQYFAIQPSHYAVPLFLVVLKSIGLYVDLITTSLKQHQHSNANLFLDTLGVPKWKTFFFFSSKSIFSILLFKLPLKFLKLTFSVMLFEALLGLQGIGSLMLNATLSYDLPIICACFVLSSVLTAACMTLSDYISHTLYETKLG